ncbi:hypothetical protein ACQEUU_15250 [Nonomuraea sp. CA-218870]|uniref:Restriction endonuclease type IV Mrr domain-containing protein n=1 Tax=Nonomuraea corallina TaxID=2989783 RepID=A0ABT4SAW7_9ACTN|nr:hypothetical protein [Nonomuraea corallina]MDA0634357.1 hypothetical protein [Nonomuraea corallina]
MGTPLFLILTYLCQVQADPADLHKENLMFIIEGKESSPATFSRKAFERFLSDLQSKGYKPLIRAAAKAILTATGTRSIARHRTLYWQTIDTVSASFNRNRWSPPPGEEYQTRELLEIMIRDGSLIIIRYSREVVIIVEARDHTATSHVEEISSTFWHAADAASAKDMLGNPFTWLPTPKMRLLYSLSSVNYKVKTNHINSQPASYSQQDLEAAITLATPDYREALKRVIQGKPARDDAGPASEQPAVRELLDRQLVREEYLVVCRQTSRPICTVATREELEGNLGENYRCSTCNRTFADENIRNIIAATPLARQLMEKSHWMTIWATSLLVDSKVALNNIVWNTTFDEDEIDLIVDFQGYRAFFELKDRDFGLGDADRFVNRVERYGPGAGVVFSLGSISAEARKFLTRRRVSIVEGRTSESARTEIKDIINKISTDEARRQLQNLLASMEIESQRVVVELWKRESGIEWPIDENDPYYWR